jgi:RNA polymerase sigma factor (sigma-70 family)
MERRAGPGKAIPPFQAFLDEHRTLVYRFLVDAVGPGDADDAFQDTFLAALRAYPRLRHGENLRGWIMAIASRKAVDAARARARRPHPVPDVPDEPGREASPETDEDLIEAVRRLPARQGLAVVHRILLDQSYEATAAALGCSVETARAHVYQGLKRLRSEVMA